MPFVNSYYSIQTEWAAHPAPSDSADLAGLIDAMAAMEMATLGFLGLKASYGATTLPETLSEEYPQALHLPGGGARLRSIMFGSGVSAAHPGGQREHLYGVEIFLAVGNRAELLDRLTLATLFWLRAYDYAYSRNGSLGNRCKGVRLTSASWGSEEYGGVAAFGWRFQAEITANYRMDSEDIP